MNGFRASGLPRMNNIVKNRPSAATLVGERMKKLLYAVVVLQFVLGLCSAIGYAQPPYSAADFTGPYGFGVSGNVISVPPSPPTLPCSGWIALNPPLPLAITGFLTGDGTGGLSGRQTFNANGLVCSGSLAGKYTVNADGTGTLDNVRFIPDSGLPPQCTPSVGNSSFTFSNGVNRIDLSGTDCFQVTSGSATKQ